MLYHSYNRCPFSILNGALRGWGGGGGRVVAIALDFRNDSSKPARRHFQRPARIQGAAELPWR